MSVKGGVLISEAYRGWRKLGSCHTTNKQGQRISYKTKEVVAVKR